MSERPGNLLDWLYALRDRQRQTQRDGAWVIKGKTVPWETNDQGRMQWYLHPAIGDTAIRSMMFFRQEIAPRSKSGVQKTPGGSVLYIVKGRGYTTLDGVRHDWEAEDVLNIPIRADGVAVQHVNIDPEEPAILIQADLNLADMLGLDRGSALEQIEKAPED
jgi:gentisate 1,2-dioxygenase